MIIGEPYEIPGDDMKEFMFVVEPNYSKFSHWSGHIAINYAPELLEKHPVWKDKPQAQSYNLALLSCDHNGATFTVYPREDTDGTYKVIR